MDRLNGCDFDSDAMLITNNPIMLIAAKKHYSLFGVPVGILDAKRENKKTHEIDTDISNNKIGEIINTSQWLNSIFWDKKAKGVFDTELYYDICKLAVLCPKVRSFCKDGQCAPTKDMGYYFGTLPHHTPRLQSRMPCRLMEQIPRL